MREEDRRVRSSVIVRPASPRDAASFVEVGQTIRKGQELTYHYNTDGEGLIKCRCRPGCQTLL